MVSGLQRRVKKDTGQLWAVATVEDLDAAVQVLFFPKTYEMMGSELVEDSAVAVKGRFVRRDGESSVIAMELIVLDLADAQAEADSSPLTVVIRTERVTPSLISELKSILASHPGDSQVHIKLRSEHRTLSMRIDDTIRVKASGALMGELKGVLGAGCLE